MRKALTIGELLVTMSIIGVIAVLILPSFLESYDNKVYVTKLKKIVGTIENAVNQACADNNVSYFYQTPYGTYSADASPQREFIQRYFKVVTSNNVRFGTYGYIGNASTYKVESPDNFFSAELSSGELIGMGCSRKHDYCQLIIDTTSSKKPNIFGRDFFLINLDKKTNQLYDANPDYAANCVYKVYGQGCFARILNDNWEMKY